MDAAYLMDKLNRFFTMGDTEMPDRPENPSMDSSSNSPKTSWPFRLLQKLYRWILRPIIYLLFGVVILLMTAWSVLAIHYSNLPAAWLRTTLAVLFGITVLAIFIFVRRRWMALLAFVMMFCSVATWWSTIRPASNRDWDPSVAVLPSVTFNGDYITVHNLRNFDYITKNEFIPRYEDRSYDLNKLKRLDFIVSRWSDNPGIAHTMLSFCFGENDYLCVSVEVRKARDQTYEIIPGIFKQYELIYVLADERDLIRLRTNYRKERVYIYPTTVSPRKTRELLIDILEGANRLNAHPQFYRAIGRNCTTTLVRHINHIAEIPMEWSRGLIMNGYSDELAYQDGYISHALPFPETRQLHMVTEIAQPYIHSPEFSSEIRSHLKAFYRSLPADKHLKPTTEALPEDSHP